MEELLGITFLRYVVSAFAFIGMMFVGFVIYLFLAVKDEPDVRECRCPECGDVHWHWECLEDEGD